MMTSCATQELNIFKRVILYDQIKSGLITGLHTCQDTTKQTMMNFRSAFIDKSRIAVTYLDMLTKSNDIGARILTKRCFFSSISAVLKRDFQDVHPKNLLALRYCH